MFKVNNCTQGSDEWHRLRWERITASDFDKIITPSGKLSTQWEGVVDTKIALQLINGHEEGFEPVETMAMTRGHSLEQEALEFFNYTYGYKFEKVGFIDSGEGYGCSPDGIDFGDNVGIELKCPLAKNHVSYLRRGFPVKYKAQVQGAMLVTGFSSWVFGSYHPEMPGLCVVVERDEPYILELKKNLEMAVKEMKKEVGKWLSEIES